MLVVHIHNYQCAIIIAGYTFLMQNCELESLYRTPTWFTDVLPDRHCWRQDLYFRILQRSIHRTSSGWNDTKGTWSFSKENRPPKLSCCLIDWIAVPSQLPTNPICVRHVRASEWGLPSFNRVQEHFLSGRWHTLPGSLVGLNTNFLSAIPHHMLPTIGIP